MSVAGFDVNLMPGFSEKEAKELAAGNMLPTGLYIAEVEEVKFEGKEHEYTAKDENKNETGPFPVTEEEHAVIQVKFHILAEHNKDQQGRKVVLFLRIFNMGMPDLMARLPFNMKAMHDGSIGRIIELVNCSGVANATDSAGNRNYVATLVGADMIGQVLAIRVGKTVNKQTKEEGSEIKGFKAHSIHG